MSTYYAVPYLFMGTLLYADSFLKIPSRYNSQDCVPYQSLRHSDLILWLLSWPTSADWGLVSLVGRICQGQDNLSNQRLDCTTLTCTSSLWLMPVHIVARKPQPSGQIKTCLCLVCQSLTTDFRGSRLHVMVLLGSYSLDYLDTPLLW